MSSPVHPHDGYSYEGCVCICCLNIRALAAPPPEAGLQEKRLRAVLDNLIRHHELERIAGNTHAHADRCKFVEQAVAALAPKESDHD